MINNAAILTQQIVPVDILINISMHRCVLITTVFCTTHERFEHIFAKIM